MKTLHVLTSVILIIGTSFMLISNASVDDFHDETESTFYSTNETTLSTLQAHEKINIVFTAKADQTSFIGYVFYTIIEGNNQTTESENFTGT